MFATGLLQLFKLHRKRKTLAIMTQPILCEGEVGRKAAAY